MKQDIICKTIPYGLRYSTWPINRSATFAEQEAYTEHERQQRADMERCRAELEAKGVPYLGTHFPARHP